MKARGLSFTKGTMCVLGLLALFVVAGARAQDKSSSGCWPWPDSLDAVVADPQNHIFMYEDSNIRVLDVHTPPHTTNSKHDHQWLSIFLQGEAQPRGRDHGTDGTPTQPGGEVPADASFPVLTDQEPRLPMHGKTWTRSRSIFSAWSSRRSLLNVRARTAA